jgi:hypothetical protein
VSLENICNGIFVFVIPSKILGTLALISLSSAGLRCFIKYFVENILRRTLEVLICLSVIEGSISLTIGNIPSLPKFELNSFAKYAFLTTLSICFNLSIISCLILVGL